MTNKKRQFFGTDGIRGQANIEPMTPQTVLTVAMAAARYFKKNHEMHRPKVVIGKDPRLSGYMIENSMTSGFVSMGMDVVMVGPMPTPAVAMLTRSLRADLGVMISASHNPYEDNGIKFFGADGFKLSDDIEWEIEQRMTKSFEDVYAQPDDIGRAMRVDEESGRYVEYVKSTFPKDLDLHGLKIVVDCANGAAYKAAPKVFFELGADVIPIGIAPNGKNINLNCGATATQVMQDAVVAHGADLGIALDGDADRLIISDEKGQRIDGDQIMAVIAKDMNDRCILSKSTLVATVMSNLGLERYLDNHGMTLVRTAVGDRYVLNEMKKNGYNLGGEQSGHFIALDHSTTGDGILAALQVLAVLQRQQKKASDVLNAFTPVPQYLENITFNGANPLECQDIQKELTAANDRLSGKGRLLVRKSGTQSLIRVMVEGDDDRFVTTVLHDVCDVIRQKA